MIRPARFTDIPALYGLLLDGYRRSRYVERDRPDEKVAKALLIRMVQRHGSKSDGGACVFVAEYDGVAVGFMAGVLDRVYHIGTRLMASDVFLCVATAAPREACIDLIGAYVAWAEAIPGVIKVNLSATDAIENPETVGRLYRRIGFRQTGVIYERDVR